MNVIAGADVGGTSTRVQVEKAGTVAGQATGRAAAIRPGRAMASGAVIAETVRRALAEAKALRADVLVVGAAGAGREAERSELERALRMEAVAERVIVTTDVAIALEAAFGDGPGVVLVSGTGSAAHARLLDGREIRRGGYGWQMGDEGSGYAIGRAALLAVSRAQDRGGPDLALASALLGVTRCGSFDDLVRWAGAAGPPEVASLAPVVQSSAVQGDPAAREILDEAGDRLVDLVRSLLTEFGQKGPVRVALAGGLLSVPSPGMSTNPLRDRVLDGLRQLPPAAPVEETIDAVRGALALARRAAR